MTAGMAEVIAAHQLLEGREAGSPWMRLKESAWCSCGHDHGSWIDGTDADHPDWEKIHATHVAEELAKAGYGNVQEALLAAADEMPIETLAGADKASGWLRQRAHSLDPEGRALVQAIHDRKAEG